MDEVLKGEKTIFDRVRDYYRGERISNALLFVLGSGAILWTLLLYLWRQGQLSTGLFYSAFPLSIFFIITGLYRFIRSLKRYKLTQAPLTGKVFLVENELPHLEGRSERFHKKRKVDTIGFIIGFATMILSVFFGWNHLLLGTSISLTIFSSILLIFDLFGQFRTDELINHVKRISE